MLGIHFEKVIFDQEAAGRAGSPGPFSVRFPGSVARGQQWVQQSLFWACDMPTYPPYLVSARPWRPFFPWSGRDLPAATRWGILPNWSE